MMSPLKTGLCMGLGSVFVVLGAIMVVFWPTIFLEQLKKRMILTEESQSFELWRETPIPMYLECYMWNITNMHELLAGTADMLHVEQIGPYVYREEHIKANITFNANATVTFYNQRWWHYEPSMSNGSLSDMITSVNPIIATVAYTVRHRGAMVRPLVDGFLRLYHKDMFMTANVSAWLFDGISDPVLDLGQRFPEIANIPYDKFGWFYKRNGSMEFDGVFVMDTGAVDYSRLGNVALWRGSERTTWRGDCGAVQGSTGELWAPELGQPEVAIFSSDICTHMTLANNGSVKIQGIEGVMYAANDSLFDNGHRYESMACYCDDVSSADCLPSGALNVSACRLGAPAVVTLPHMRAADPHYPAKVDGMSPDVNHTFRFALEMYTGIPLYVAAQLQINLLVRHVPGVTINNALPDPDTLVPMFWFRQEVHITPEYARLARAALLARAAVPIGFYVVTGIGILLLVYTIVAMIKRLLRSPETDGILSSSQDEVQ